MAAALGPLTAVLAAALGPDMWPQRLAPWSVLAAALGPERLGGLT